uniref:Uncharacterized protein n=1 Tax=Nelumbo nucifera TaxID=4432 RepID=A0A822Y511_NELNU|nr:TPA_asm: hypothetical protein HUJ06_027877 [Nelumbo nucifera]
MDQKYLYMRPSNFNGAVVQDPQAPILGPKAPNQAGRVGLLYFSSLLISGVAILDPEKYSSPAKLLTS